MKEKIVEAIKNMNTNEAVALWNEYCNKANRMDDYLYRTEEFDEIMGDNSGKFRPAYNWFWFNGYAKMESSDYPTNNSKSPFYADELASWIVEHENALYCDEIQEILDEEAEEAEEAEETDA